MHHTAVPCCRCDTTPTINAVNARRPPTFTGQVRAPLGEMRALCTTSFSLLRNLSGKIVASNGRSSRPISFSVASDLFRVSSSISSVGARAYYSESGFQYGRGQEQQQFGQVEQDADQFPRPPLIQWEKELANAVQLIGNVGRDVDIKYLDTGKIVAKTSLAVKKVGQKNEDPSWFELEFWDGLAEVAAHHVRKGDQIFVHGKISVDKSTTPDNTYTRVKIAVSNLCFVESYSGQRRAYTQPGTSQDAGFGDRADSRWPRSSSSGAQPEQTWDSPSLSPQQPAQTAAGSSGTVVKGTYEEESLATEKRWQAFFADPSQWWDNRLNKKNPKAPDFKHKSTQEVLWLNSWSNPPWVAAQLAAWEEKQAQTGGGQRTNRNSLSSFKDSDFM
ncbi:hypothetical protein R1sor_003590 [Riccia sorocarpa]|uniref:Uncharacterized protein n=1 Tax=Riccia sorocarpa TaxID=122646 RepID=A0ABD3H2U5_9MARC